MKNATQLKAIIKNLAKEKHISAQLVMQNFMLERLLERISVSKYKQNFILKDKCQKASKINGFAKQKGAYYTTTTPFLKES